MQTRTALPPAPTATTITFTNSDTGQGTQTRTATLTVNAPVLQVTPTTNIVAAGTQGALSPSSFQYQLSANAGSVNYSISGVPNWLTPSSTSGTASTSGTTVTFTVNANANSSCPQHLHRHYHFHQFRHRPGHPDADGDAHRQCARAASNAHRQYRRRRKSRRTPSLFIPIPTQCERRHRQLFNFGRPELAHPFFNLGQCVLFRHYRDLYGECKREQPCPRHLRPNHYHFHQFRHRPGHPDPDGDAHGQSASAAGRRLPPTLPLRGHTAVHSRRRRSATRSAPRSAA